MLTIFRATAPCCSLIILLLLTWSCSRPTLHDRVKGYLSAHNSHEVEETMVFYAEDCQFTLPGQQTIAGKSNVRALEEFDAVVNSELLFSDVEGRGDTVFIGQVRERNDWFRLAGIDEVHYQPGSKFIFRNGFITQIRPADLTAASAEALEGSLQAITKWASRERSKLLAELMPEGKFVYNAETARKWLELLRDWRKQVGVQ